MQTPQQRSSLPPLFGVPMLGGRAAQTAKGGNTIDTDDPVAVRNFFLKYYDIANAPQAPQLPDLTSPEQLGAAATNAAQSQPTGWEMAGINAEREKAQNAALLGGMQAPTPQTFNPFSYEPPPAYPERQSPQPVQPQLNGFSGLGMLLGGLVDRQGASGYAAAATHGAIASAEKQNAQRQQEFQNTIQQDARTYAANMAAHQEAFQTARSNYDTQRSIQAINANALQAFKEKQLLLKAEGAGSDVSSNLIELAQNAAKKGQTATALLKGMEASDAAKQQKYQNEFVRQNFLQNQQMHQTTELRQGLSDLLTNQASDAATTGRTEAATAKAASDQQKHVDDMKYKYDTLNLHQKTEVAKVIASDPTVSQAQKEYDASQKEYDALYRELKGKNLATVKAGQVPTKQQNDEATRMALSDQRMKALYNASRSAKQKLESASAAAYAARLSLFGVNQERPKVKLPGNFSLDNQTGADGVDHLGTPIYNLGGGR